MDRVTKRNIEWIWGNPQTQNETSGRFLINFEKQNPISAPLPASGRTLARVESICI